MPCTGTPISWLRLERFAASGVDADIAAHVSTCAACASCLDEIRRDVVALPPLAVATSSARRRPWWYIALPAFAAAAAIAMLLVRPRDPARDERVRVKGVGEVIVGVVRERDGAIRDDATTFVPSDRWKVVITCPPAAATWVEVEIGGDRGVDRPLAPARIACGNRVVVPGAFHLTGTAANRICVRVAADEPDARAPTARLTVGPDASP
jgi:hypothetical protein